MEAVAKKAAIEKAAIAKREAARAYLLEHSCGPQEVTAKVHGFHNSKHLDNTALLVRKRRARQLSSSSFGKSDNSTLKNFESGKLCSWGKKKENTGFAKKKSVAGSSKNAKSSSNTTFDKVSLLPLQTKEFDKEQSEKLAWIEVQLPQSQIIEFQGRTSYWWNTLSGVRSWQAPEDIEYI